MFCFCFLRFLAIPIACGISVPPPPPPGTEPAPSALEVQSLNHWSAGEVPIIKGFFCLFVCVVVLDPVGLDMSVN